MIIAFLILGTILSAAIWWYTRPLTIEERQALALKRHKKSREADRKRADAYWRERAKTIKPVRFCSDLDENETPT